MSGRIRRIGAAIVFTTFFSGCMTAQDKVVMAEFKGELNKRIEEKRSPDNQATAQEKAAKAEQKTAGLER